MHYTWQQCDHANSLLFARVFVSQFKEETNNKNALQFFFG